MDLSLLDGRWQEDCNFASKEKGSWRDNKGERSEAEFFHC